MGAALQTYPNGIGLLGTAIYDGEADRVRARTSRASAASASSETACAIRQPTATLATGNAEVTIANRAYRVRIGELRRG
jgi:hypothetical protein